MSMQFNTTWTLATNSHNRFPPICPLPETLLEKRNLMYLNAGSFLCTWFTRARLEVVIKQYKNREKKRETWLYLATWYADGNSARFVVYLEIAWLQRQWPTPCCLHANRFGLEITHYFAFSDIDRPSMLIFSWLCELFFIYGRSNRFKDKASLLLLTVSTS